MLKLIKLSLQGFGCFKDKTEFLYEDGVNIIHAENGKGKSTSLQALELLLLSSSEFNYSDLMNRECNEFILSLEFYLDNKHLLQTLICKKGKTYTATRNLKDLDNNIDLANNDGTKEYLEQYLPVVTSKYALFVRQNSDIDIVHCPDSERRELFKRIQNLNFDSQIKTLIDPKIEQTKNKIIEVDKEIFAYENKSYESKILNDLPFDEDEYKVKQTELAKLNAEKALQDERRKRYEEQLSEKEKADSEIASCQKQIQDKKNSISRCVEYLDSVQSEKDKIVTRCEENKVQIENKISSLKAQIDDLDDKKEDEAETIRNDINNLSGEIESLTQEMNSIKLMKLVKFDEDALVKARDEKSKLRTKSSIAWSNAEKLKSGICPCCGRSGCEHKYQELADEATAYDKQIAEAEAVIDDLIQKKNSYEESSKKNQENKDKKNGLQGKIETKQSRLDSLNKSLEGLNELYDSKQTGILSQISNEEQKYSREEEKCVSDCKAIDDKAEMMRTQKSEYENMISEYEEKIVDLNKKLLDIGQKLCEYEVTERCDFSECDSLSSEIKKYESCIAENKVVDEYNKQVELTKSEDKKQLEICKEKKQKFEKEVYVLNNAKTILTKDYPNWVILNSIQNIEDDINEFISQVYYKELGVRFESKTGIKMTMGKDIPIKRASGCESAIIKIGFINSFNKNLGLGALILDEPDAPMSDSVKNEFYASLLEMREQFHQMIIVTHSEKMSAFIRANTDCNLIEL